MNSSDVASECVCVCRASMTKFRPAAVIVAHWLLAVRHHQQ